MGGKPRTNMTQFWNRVDMTGDCWNWTGYRNNARYGKGNGYGVLRFWGRKQLAHRLAYLFTYGTVPDGMHVLHRCDNPACCNPKHLFIGTPNDNTQDAMLKGRVSHASKNQGEKHAKHKLTEGDVLKIRDLYSVGNKTQKELGKKFGVDQTEVSMILNRKRWGWLP